MSFPSKGSTIIFIIIFPEIEKLRRNPKISNLSEQYPDKSISFVSNGLLIVSVLLCTSNFAV